MTVTGDEARVWKKMQNVTPEDADDESEKALDDFNGRFDVAFDEESIRIVTSMSFPTGSRAQPRITQVSVSGKSEDKRYAALYYVDTRGNASAVRTELTPKKIFRKAGSAFRKVLSGISKERNEKMTVSSVSTTNILSPGKTRPTQKWYRWKLTGDKSGEAVELLLRADGSALQADPMPMLAIQEPVR